MSTDTHVTLIAADKDETKVMISRAATKHSELLSNLLEDVDDSAAAEIPCNNIDSGDALRVIVAFLEEYQEKVIGGLGPEDRQRLTANNFNLLFEEAWVKKYRRPIFNSENQLEAAPENQTTNEESADSQTTEDQTTNEESADSQTTSSDNIDQYKDLLFETMEGAEYLQIDPLINITAHQTALMIRDLKPEELKKIFEVPSNSTSESNPGPESVKSSA